MGHVTRSLIVGHGGREAALGVKMAEDSCLHAFVGHANPTLGDLVARTGGSFEVGDVCNGEEVARFATESDIDIAMVSSDGPLEAGVVDALRAVGIPTVGPTRSGAEIEWNKIFCREVINHVAPEANPVYAVARTIDEVDEAG